MNVSTGIRSSASCSRSMLPRDFDIFSPESCSMPLCAHTWAKGRPAAHDWASSFSWWGKIRSRPPPCTRKLAAQELLGHRRALDVPPRPAAPQGESQATSSSGFCGLPQREVERVALVLAGLDPPARLQLVRPLAGERAVRLTRPHREVDVAAGLVGLAAVDQLLDQRDDLGDRLGGPRLTVGTADAEPIGVGEEVLASSPAASCAELISALARPR